MGGGGGGGIPGPSRWILDYATNMALPPQGFEPLLY